MNDNTIMKLHWTVKMFSAVIAISLLILVFDYYRKQTVIDLWTTVSLWGTYWDILLMHIFFLIAVAVAWRWTLIGGVLLAITTTTEVIRELVRIKSAFKYVDSRVSDQMGLYDSTAIKLSTTGWLAIALLVCGLAYIYIATRNRKIKASST